MDFDYYELDKLVDKEIAEILDMNSDPLIKRVKLKVGERRDAAILFLDIKGFTAMSVELDVEDVVDTLKPIFAAFTKVIKKYQGSVDKYEGDAIMAVFGGKRATENDIENAIRAGLEMHYLLPQFNKKYKPLVDSGMEMKMRIGIHFGEVLVTEIGIEESVDETVYGTSVNIAARLEPVCPIGKILITKEIKMMVEHIFTFSLFKKITLTGIQESVELWIVEGIKPGYHERWDREDLFKDTKFIGREKELKQLTNLYKKKKKDSIKYSIKAPAGMGKSRLVFEFINKFEDIPVLRGRCASYFPPSLFVIKDILYNFVTEDRKHKFTKELFENSMKRLFINDDEQNKISVPILGNILGFEITDDRKKLSQQLLFKEKQTAFGVFLKYFTDSSPKNPIFVFDDLQWIDELSIKMFDFFLNNVEFTKPVFFIFLCREYFKLPFIDEKTIEHRIFLDSLSEENCNEMIKNTLPGLNSENENLKKIVSASGGTPFYLEEFIRILLMRNCITEEAGSFSISDDQIDISPPASLKSLVLSRIDYLNPELKKTVQAASIIGRSFFFKHLYHISKKLEQFSTTDIMKNVKLVERLKYILERQTVQELEYAFRDILSWETIYDTILFSNKKILHRMVAEAYEETGESVNFPDITAEHYFNSDRIKKSVSWLEIAIEKNINSYDTNKALKQLSMLESIQTLTPKNLIDKAELYILRGEYQIAETVLDKMKSSAEVIFQKGKINSGQSSFKEAIECYSEAFSVFNKESNIVGMLKSKRLMGIAYYEIGEYSLAKDVYREALTIAENLNSKTDIGKIYNQLGVCAERLNDFDKAENMYKQGLLFAKGDQLLYSDVHGNIGNLFFKKGKYEEAENFYKTQLKIVRAIPFREGIGKATGNLAVSLLYQDKESEALTYFEYSLKTATDIGDRLGRVFALTNIADMQKYFGSLDESEKNSLKCLELCSEIEDMEGYIQSLGNLGDIFLQREEFSKARDNFLKAIKTSEEKSCTDFYIIPAIYFGLMQSELLLGNKKEARSLKEKTIAICNKAGRDDIIQHVRQLF